MGELVEGKGGVGQGTRVAKTYAMHFAVPKHFLAFFCLLSSRVGELVEGNGGVGQGTRGAKAYAVQLLILCRRVGLLLCRGIKRQSVHYTAYQMVGVVSIVSCLSFVCLWASCLPCSLYVVRCAFKNKAVVPLDNVQNMHRY